MHFKVRVHEFPVALRIRGDITLLIHQRTREHLQEHHIQGKLACVTYLVLGGNKYNSKQLFEKKNATVLKGVK